MRRDPGPGTTVSIFLYIFGIALVITAVVMLLRGLGILGQIPDYIIWALVLLTVGMGIITALDNMRGRS